MDRFKPIFYFQIRFPSDKKRFIRDNPSKVPLPNALLKKMRGPATYETLVEQITFSPWRIMKSRVFDKVLSDILFLLMMDEYMANYLDIEDWFEDNVNLNISIEKDKTIINSQGQVYPAIVQDFSHFNVYYKNNVYVYNDGPNSFAKWVKIMQGHPHYGIYNNMNLALLMKNIE